MKRPQYVDIGPYRWDITYDKTGLELKHLARLGVGDVHGLTIHSELRIIIEDGLNDQFLKDTVLHEILHALCYTHNIDVPFSMEEKDRDEREEKLVAALSTALLDVMQRNPHIFKWLNVKVPN